MTLLGVLGFGSGGQGLEVWLCLCLSLLLDHFRTNQILEKIIISNQQE